MELERRLKDLIKTAIGPSLVAKVKKSLIPTRPNNPRTEYNVPPIKALSREQLRTWNELGFLVLPKFFDRIALETITKYIDRLWDGESEALVADIFMGTPREERVRLKNAPSEARKAPHKLNNLYLESQVIREIVLEIKLSALIAELLGGPPLICNTLNLEYGSQQSFHTDSLYMTPPVGTNLVASWIALEDCRPDAGPLRYYPASHRIPPFLFSHGKMTAIGEEMRAYADYMRAQVGRRGLEESRFCAKAGDVFIWHSQLFHGGAPIEDQALTRRSLVTHYFLARDLPGNHGEVGPGRYYLVREPVLAPGE